MATSPSVPRKRRDEVPGTDPGSTSFADAGPGVSSGPRALASMAGSGPLTRAVYGRVTRVRRMTSRSVGNRLLASADDGSGDPRAGLGAGGDRADPGGLCRAGSPPTTASSDRARLPP